MKPFPLKPLSILKIIVVFALPIILVGIALAQNVQQFSVNSFEVDPFDFSAKDGTHEKIDGNGDRYAIIKVTSTNPLDNLREYNFNFGNLKHEVDEHDGSLWIYVQKNAKIVSITRDGYAPISRYDLHTTIESGKNYTMVLSSQPKKIKRQMTVFKVTPVDSKAFVTIKNITDDSSEEPVGVIDGTGSVAKNLPFGTYSYKVLADNYQTMEGLITLNDKSATFIEQVNLTPNFSMITLKVNSDAQIFIDYELKGLGEWTGPLKAGVYQIECRKDGCKPSSQMITIEDNIAQTITLSEPQRITGDVSVFSNPLGTYIQIDGKNFGVTPQNIELPTGKHSLELALDGYKSCQMELNISEHDDTEVNVSLEKLDDGKNISLKASTTGSADDIQFSLNMKMKDYGTVKNENNYDWKDGSTIFISCLDKCNSASSGETMYARYSSSDGWRLHNFNGVEIDETPVYQVLCFEKIDGMENRKIDQFRKTLYYTDSNHTGYVDRFMSDGEWVGPQSTFSFKDGKFQLNTKLVPLYGRVRFVTDVLPSDSVSYNHAQNCIKGDVWYKFRGYANNGTPVSKTKTMKFHKEQDGKYYSDYIYARAIPEVKIGNVVYRYNNHRSIFEGNSETIALPNRKDLADCWTPERYFHELKTNTISYSFDPGEPIYIDLEDLKFYRVLKQMHDNRSKYMSSVGLYVSVEYDIEINGDQKNVDVYLNIDNGSPDYKKNYYEGISNSYRRYTISTSGRLTAHCCSNANTPVGFYPYIKIIPNSFSSGILKIKRVWISDFY